MSLAVPSESPGRATIATSDGPVSHPAARAVADRLTACVLHTDRGSQFRARKLVHQLNPHQMLGSMGRVGGAGDNAAMELLLSVSSGHQSRKNPEEVPGVVALQPPHRLAVARAVVARAFEAISS